MNEINPHQTIALASIQSNGNDVRQERADAAANRQVILQTAERLFAERGVENVCMAEIAAVAGVGKGTLYRRYPNKAELCLALMDTQLLDFQNRMLGEFNRLSTAGAGYLTQLSFFLTALVEFTELHAPLLGEVERAGLIGEGAPPTMPHFWQFMTVHVLLGQAARAGEISGSLDLEFLGEALLAPLQSDFFRFQRRAKGFSIERIQAGLTRLVDLLADTGDDAAG